MRFLRADYNIINQASQIYNKKKLAAYVMTDIMLPIMHTLAARTQSEASEIVKQVMQLIKEEKGTITLNECADRLNYHPNYIWKVLKTEKKVTFTELANEERLDLAKYTLLTSDDSIAAISDRLKYNNVQNFIRFFKAQVGSTWSSLCANWLTRWERFHDPVYRDKITAGMADIKAALLKLISGPDFEFDPEHVRLRYIGEQAAGGTHLQVCMGSPQVWMEMAELLGDEEWKQMMADYGRFYYLPKTQQQIESRGLIGDREFTLPFMAAAMGAYGAAWNKDQIQAEITWQHLLGALIHDGNHDGFGSIIVPEQGNCRELLEIPWISTNFTAQWCLNVIVALEFIREQLPDTVDARIKWRHLSRRDFSGKPDDLLFFKYITQSIN